MNHYNPKNGWIGIMMRLTLLFAGFYRHRDDRTGNGLPTHIKTSKGLESLYIDFNKFNLRAFNEDGMMRESIRTFNEVIRGVKAARKDWKVESAFDTLSQTKADERFWAEVKDRAEALDIGLVGFSRVDENLMFVQDHIGRITGLYPNAIVLGMEMDADQINTSPAPASGLEAMRIYAKLGIATNELAGFIRSKGHRAIACHPLGGPILLPPMAEKANLGEMGRNGLLVSEKYGPRQRLSMITTTADPLPESTRKFYGVSEFCKKCGKCIHACPVNAIREEPIVRENYGIASCVDSKKCLPYFCEYNGCSICIKVCPFHRKDFHKLMEKS
jgi:epoxyqueuosine reductase QueG